MCVVADGENTVAPFGFQRHSAGFKEVHTILTVEAAVCGIEEATVDGNICEKVLVGTVVCNVAPALARNSKLSSALLPLFNQEHAFSVICGCYGGNHSCRTAAYYNAIKKVVLHNYSLLSVSLSVFSYTSNSS